jgi:Icc protein
VRLVMLDTVVPGYGHGELCARRLAWLERTLAAAPERPTVIGMHHPPFACGIEHMDKINLRQSAEFTAIVARHRQVARILCGHHHRPITAQVAHTIAMVGPSVAHQVELALAPGAAAAFVMEPPAYLIHRYTAEAGIVTHQAYVDDYPGPFPFLAEADYPGKVA